SCELHACHEPPSKWCCNSYSGIRLVRKKEYIQCGKSSFMKRILYIVSTLYGSGPINQLQYLLRYLDRSRFEPLILTLSPEPPGSIIKAFLGDGIDVQTLGMSRITGLLKG